MADLTTPVTLLNAARYSVPLDGRLTVADGVELMIRPWFQVDGLLILSGLLSVCEKRDQQNV